MDLAVDAGYGGGLAVQALTILEHLALDRGAIGDVFGPENLFDPTDPNHDSAAYRVQRWLWTHLHGYLPLHERVDSARRRARARSDRGAVA